MYESRLKAKAEKLDTHAYIFKLLLNSLYGKTGQKEIINFFKLIPLKDEDIHRLTYDTDLSQKFDKMILVRDHGKLSPSITKQIKYEGELEEDSTSATAEDDKEYLSDLLEDDEYKSSKKEGYVGGSVCIAAAITAYGRIHMSRFKNITGNRYFGGDTDSVIMEHPLDDKFIGSKLGQMKLEEEIKVGLMPGKKLYFIITSDGSKISKSRGIGFGADRKSILKESDYLNIMGGEPVTVLKPKFLIKEDKVFYRDEKVRVSVSDEALQKIKNEISEYIASTSPTSKSLMSSMARKISKIMKKVDKAKAKTVKTKAKANAKKDKVVK